MCIVDDEDATLKRVYRYDNGIVALKAANPAYPDIVFTARQARALRIVGRPMMVVTELR